MKKNLILLNVLVFLLFGPDLKGQEIFHEDSISFEILKKRAVFKGDSLKMEIQDTLFEDSLYIGTVFWDASEYQTCLIKSDLNHWIIYTLFEDAIQYQYHWEEFVNIGSKELIIDYETGYGRSGWQSGHSSKSKAVLIVDLDRSLLLADLGISYCFLSWSNELEKTEPNSKEPVNILSSTMDLIEGARFSYKIHPNKIILISEETDCGEEYLENYLEDNLNASEAEVQFKSEEYTYTHLRSKLILSKK